MIATAIINSISVKPAFDVRARQVPDAAQKTL